MDWHARAGCGPQHKGNDPRWWDAEASRDDRERAHAICMACPVRRLCYIDAKAASDAKELVGVQRAGVIWTKHGPRTIHDSRLGQTSTAA